MMKDNTKNTLDQIISICTTPTTFNVTALLFKNLINQTVEQTQKEILDYQSLLEEGLLRRLKAEVSSDQIKNLSKFIISWLDYLKVDKNNLNFLKDYGINEQAFLDTIPKIHNILVSMDTEQVKELETNLVSFIMMQKSAATANLHKEKLEEILEQSLLMLQKPEAAAAGADLIFHLLNNIANDQKSQQEKDFFEKTVMPNTELIKALNDKVVLQNLLQNKHLPDMLKNLQDFLTPQNQGPKTSILFYDSLCNVLLNDEVLPKIKDKITTELVAAYLEYDIPQELLTKVIPIAKDFFDQSTEGAFINNVFNVGFLLEHGLLSKIKDGLNAQNLKDLADFIWHLNVDLKFLDDYGLNNNLSLRELLANSLTLIQSMKKEEVISLEKNLATILQSTKSNPAAVEKLSVELLPSLQNNPTETAKLILSVSKIAQDRFLNHIINPSEDPKDLEFFNIIKPHAGVIALLSDQTILEKILKSKYLTTFTNNLFDYMAAKNKTKATSALITSALELIFKEEVFEEIAGKITKQNISPYFKNITGQINEKNNDKEDLVFIKSVVDLIKQDEVESKVFADKLKTIEDFLDKKRITPENAEGMFHYLELDNEPAASDQNPNIVAAIDLALENIHPNALKWTNGNIIINDLIAPLMKDLPLMQKAIENGIEKAIALQTRDWSWQNFPSNALAVVAAVISMPKEARKIGGNFIISCIKNRLSKSLMRNKTNENKNSITQYFSPHPKIGDFKENYSIQNGYKYTP